jgi:hypothetical protein
MRRKCDKSWRHGHFLLLVAKHGRRLVFAKAFLRNVLRRDFQPFQVKASALGERGGSMQKQAPKQMGGIGMSVRRYLAVGVFGLVGSGLAFFVGAKVGSSLDHHTKTVSVAHIPMPTVQAPDEDQPPTAVAVVK